PSAGLGRATNGRSRRERLPLTRRATCGSLRRVSTRRLLEAAADEAPPIPTRSELRAAVAREAAHRMPRAVAQKGPHEAETQPEAPLPGAAAAVRPHQLVLPMRMCSSSQRMENSCCRSVRPARWKVLTATRP